MHTLLVTVHAVAALVATVTGGTALVRPRWIVAHLAALSVSGTALAGVALLSPSPGLRWVDLALLLLFAAAVVRAARAAGVPAVARRTSERFVGGVGFGLVALADGFLVVAVLDLGAPVWALVVVGVGVAVVGHLVLTGLLRRRVGGAGRRAVGTAGVPTSRVGREI